MRYWALSKFWPGGETLIGRAHGAAAGARLSWLALGSSAGVLRGWADRAASGPGRSERPEIIGHFAAEVRKKKMVNSSGHALSGNFPGRPGFLEQRLHQQMLVFLRKNDRF